MKIAVAMSTFNDADRAARAVSSLLMSATSHRVTVAVVDDGSTEPVLERIRERWAEDPRLTLVSRPHRERGVARVEALELAFRETPDFVCFLDADMAVDPGFIDAAVDLSLRDGFDALILEETPVSDSDNFATRVKVFERSVINATRAPVSATSIEAARFFTAEGWRLSGGLNPHQTAFEEIQPTLRLLERGGRVGRLSGPWLIHDEKHVRFRELFSKKAGYFDAMDATFRTESSGFLKAAARWYPFRGVYYEPQNVAKYVQHPILAAGMVGMYAGLTTLAVGAVVRNWTRRAALKAK